MRLVTIASSIFCYIKRIFPLTLNPPEYRRSELLKFGLPALYCIAESLGVEGWDHVTNVRLHLEHQESSKECAYKCVSLQIWQVIIRGGSSRQRTGTCEAVIITNTDTDTTVVVAVSLAEPARCDWTLMTEKVIRMQRSRLVWAVLHTAYPLSPL